MVHKFQAGGSVPAANSTSPFGQLLDALSATAADNQDSSQGQDKGDSPSDPQAKGKAGADAAPASLILALSGDIAKLAKAADAKDPGTANDNEIKTEPKQDGDAAKASAAPAAAPPTATAPPAVAASAVQPNSQATDPEIAALLTQLPTPAQARAEASDDSKPALLPKEDGPSNSPVFSTGSGQDANALAVAAGDAPQTNQAAANNPPTAKCPPAGQHTAEETKAIGDALASQSTAESIPAGKTGTAPQTAKPQRAQAKSDTKDKGEHKNANPPAAALVWDWNAAAVAAPLTASLPSTSSAPVPAQPDANDSDIAIGNLPRTAGDSGSKPAPSAGQPPQPQASAAPNGNAQANCNTALNAPGVQPDAVAGAPAKTSASSGDSKPAQPADKPGLAVTAQAPVAPQTPANAANISVLAPNPLPAHGPSEAPSVTQHIQIGAASDSHVPNIASLAVVIAAKAQSGNKEFDIRLDPPELGRVDVRLSIDQNGKAQASLAADQSRTLDLLRNDAPQLTRALRDAGLNVAQNGLNFSLRGQDRQNANGNSGARSHRPSLSLTAVSQIGAAHGAVRYQGPADGRLDIRV